MQRMLMLCAVVAALASPNARAAHGGTYRGPGDLVPPTGGVGTAPTAPDAPTDPANPGKPTTPSLPGQPGQGITPGIAPIPVVTPTEGGLTPRSFEPDLTTWEFWWEFNKEPYLNLKAKIHAEAAVTGESSTFILGLKGGSRGAITRAPSAQQMRGVVVPALHAALAGSDDRDIATAAMIALAKIGDPAVPDTVAPFLASRNQEIAETAALSLGIYQAAESLPALRALALDDAQGRKLSGRPTGVPVRTRAFAVYGLGQIGAAASDAALREETARTLLALLRGDDSAAKDLRVSCVIALGLLRLEDPSIVTQELSALLADEGADDLVRAHCPNAIAKLLRNSSAEAVQVDAAVAQCAALLGNRKTNARVRESCVQALGLLVDGRSVHAPDVAALLMDLAENGRSRQERNFTAISLAHIGARTDTGSALRGKITHFLLVGMRGSAGSQYRPWSSLGLGVMAFRLQEAGEQVSSVVPVALLEAFASTKAPSERACHAIALGLMKAESAKKPIHAAMNEVRDPAFRGYAAVALGLLDAREHQDSMSALVRESRRLPVLLQQAAIGLGLTSDPQSVDLLLEIMKGERGRSPALSVLAATATALGFIGDARSVDPLVRMLENDQEHTPLARAFAAVALGMVGDKGSLPWNSAIAEDLNYRAVVGTLTDPASGTGLLDIR